MLSRRRRELRRGFKVPFRIGPSQILDFALHPRWSLATLMHGVPRFGNNQSARGGSSRAFDRSQGRAEPVFSVESGADGRITGTAVVEVADEGRVYELVFHTGEYFDREGLVEQARIMPEVVFRLRLPDPDARYHVPVIVSPHGYSVWWSG